jgi:hypothetical protein
MQGCKVPILYGRCVLRPESVLGSKRVWRVGAVVKIASRIFINETAGQVRISLKKNTRWVNGGMWKVEVMNGIGEMQNC